MPGRGDERSEVRQALWEPELRSFARSRCLCYLRRRAAQYASAFNQPLQSWDVSSATEIARMFEVRAARTA